MSNLVFLCDLCGSANHVRAMSSLDFRLGIPTEYQLYRCETCGLVGLWPQPDAELMQASYPDWLWEEEILRRQTSPTRSYDRQLNILRRYHPVPGHLLDVGCATGSFVLAASAKGWQAQGIDVSERQIEFGRKLGADLAVCLDFTRYQSEPIFDAITFNHVLEHVSSPYSCLKKAAELLKPGGIVLISVPNYDGLSRRLLGKYSMHLDVPRHLFHFTPRTLQKLAKSAGCCIVEIRFNDHEHNTAGVRESLRRWLIFGVLRRKLAPHVPNATRSAGTSTAQKLVKIPYYLSSVLTARIAEALRMSDTFTAVAVPDANTTQPTNPSGSASNE